MRYRDKWNQAIQLSGKKDEKILRAIKSGGSYEFFKIMLTASRFWLLLTFLDNGTMVICCCKNIYIYMCQQRKDEFVF